MPSDPDPPGRRRRNLTLPSPRKARQCYSSPGTFLASPSDSGYETGSFPATPDTPLTPLTPISPISPISPTGKRPIHSAFWASLQSPLYASLDGPGSIRGEDSGHGDDEWSSEAWSEPSTPALTKDWLTTPPRTPTSPFGPLLSPRSIKVHSPDAPGFVRSPRDRVTLPKRSQRSRLSLPAGFYSDTGIKARRQRAKAARLRTTNNSFKQCDRFIVPRSCLDASLAEVFRTNKLPHELSKTKKMLRNEDASPDAFCFRRRQVTPIASDYRVISRSESGPSWTTTGEIRLCRVGKWDMG
jgi:hypothetical protein